MSIADRITSMSNNLSNAYDGIEYLGVDTTGVDKNLQNLSSMLNVVYEGLPKVSDEGVSPSIDGSRVGRLNTTLKASDTTQESTTGKNLFNASAGVNGYIDNSGNIVDRAWQFASDYIPIQSNQEYTISVNTVSENIGTAFYDSNKQIISRADHANISSYNFTNSSNYSYIRFWVNIGNYTPLNSTNIAETYHAQLEQGTATSYEPYTGGIPSPNPDYPQDIHVVKGNNTVEVGGIQLFDINDIENGYFTGDPGVANTSLHGFHTTKYIPVGDNAKIYFRFEALDNIQIGRFYVQEYDENFISLKRTSSSVYDTKFTEGQVRKYNITLNEKTKYVRFSTYVIKVLENETYVEKQPAKDYWGTYIKTTVSFTDVDIYKDYEYSSYPINLPAGMELCKIGDYQDKLFKAVVGDTIYDALTSEQKEGLVSGGWYKYGEAGKYVANNDLTNNGATDYFISLLTPALNVTEDLSGAAFETISKTNLMATRANSVYTGYSGLNGTTSARKIRVTLSKNYCTDVPTANTFLTNNNFTIYFPLETPTITQITDTTLILQLENLYKAQSKNGQTNVLQTNADNPFVIYASALKGE